MGRAHHATVDATNDTRRAFRDCVGRFATGVTVVTSQAGGVRAGMTANSFSSVSLEPLLVQVALAHQSRTLDAVEASGRYAVSILGCDQEAVARAFARSDAPFPDEFIHVDEDGFLTIPGCLAVLRCKVDQRVTAGDHDIVIGEVVGFDAAEGAPLTFWRGAFGQFVPDRAELRAGVGA